MNEKYKKQLTYVIYTLIVGVIFVLIFWLGNLKPFQNFVNKIEASSYDLRQIIISNYKKSNDDIIIVAVDDATYEYIMNRYGSWPITRQVWSDMVEYIEQGQPKNIIFDMLFLKPNLYDRVSDRALINTVKKHDNVFLSMNFDNYDERVRTSPVIDKKFHLNVENGSIKENEHTTFVNARTVMKDLSDVTKNIGLINTTRDQDGIIRTTTPIFKYKGNYYPNLSLKAGMDVLNVDKVTIKDNTIFLDKNHIIPLDSTQRAYLNWYGKSQTYSHIPMWQIIQAKKDNNQKYLESFKNKIVYVGTTAISLSDIKSVPTDYHIAGVEIHATFLNNILDNNFIKKVSAKTNFIISIILSIIVGCYVLKTVSVFKTVLFLLFTIGLYGIISTLIMYQYNLWIGMILPYFSITSVFIFTYCAKYLLKSKDYEQTYKLAVTDGLTQLFNHRYFQEQMIVNVNNYTRYGTNFSLILIDIDFFKKFNDTYGHQSGDCVLKQVANILKKNSRTSDVACRYGGEEMSIILTNTTKKDAIITANKICSAVRNYKFILANNEKVHVTISVGVATVGENGNKPQEIIEYSDKCLYKAKESGRDQVVFEV